MDDSRDRIRTCGVICLVLSRLATRCSFGLGERREISHSPWPPQFSKLSQHVAALRPLFNLGSSVQQYNNPLRLNQVEFWYVGQSCGVMNLNSASLTQLRFFHHKRSQVRISDIFRCQCTLKSWQTVATFYFGRSEKRTYMYVQSHDLPKHEPSACATRAIIYPTQVRADCSYERREYIT
jgi:hypothetical protein